MLKTSSEARLVVHSAQIFCFPVKCFLLSYASAVHPLLPDVMDLLVFCLYMLTSITQLHPSGSQGQRSL